MKYSLEKGITFFFLYCVFKMIHRLFQTGCEQLQNDVLSNFCSKIYKVGHFPEAPKSVPGASESGRYSVGKPFTFSGKKSPIFFGWPFVMQRLLQTSKPESSSSFWHSCTSAWLCSWMVWHSCHKAEPCSEPSPYPFLVCWNRWG